MYSFFTELDIEVCMKRIDENISNNVFTTNKLRGNVSYQENKFYMSKEKAYCSNSFSRIFYGKLTKTENGTLIEGEFKRHILVRFIIIMLLGLVALGGIKFLIIWPASVILGTTHGNAVTVKEYITPLIMLSGGFLLVKSGVWFYRAEENYVLEFIRAELEAKILEAEETL